MILILKKHLTALAAMLGQVWKDSASMEKVINYDHSLMN